MAHLLLFYLFISFSVIQFAIQTSVVGYYQKVAAETII